MNRIENKGGYEQGWYASWIFCMILDPDRSFLNPEVISPIVTRQWSWALFNCRRRTHPQGCFAYGRADRLTSEKTGRQTVQQKGQTNALTQTRASLCACIWVWQSGQKRVIDTGWDWQKANGRAIDVPQKRSRWGNKNADWAVRIVMHLAPVARFSLVRVCVYLCLLRRLALVECNGVALRQNPIHPSLHPASG